MCLICILYSHLFCISFICLFKAFSCEKIKFGCLKFIAQGTTTAVFRQKIQLNEKKRLAAEEFNVCLKVVCSCDAGSFLNIF